MASSAPFSPKGLSITGVSDIISDVVTTRVEGMLRKGTFQLLHETQKALPLSGLLSRFADEREMLHGKRVPPECSIRPYAAA